MQSNRKNPTYTQAFKHAYNNIDNFMAGQNTNIPNILRFELKNNENIIYGVKIGIFSIKTSPGK